MKNYTCSCCAWCGQTGANLTWGAKKLILLHAKCQPLYEAWLLK